MSSLVLACKGTAESLLPILRRARRRFAGSPLTPGLSVIWQEINLGIVRFTLVSPGVLWEASCIA